MCKNAEIGIFILIHLIFAQFLLDAADHYFGLEVTKLKISRFISYGAPRFGLIIDVGC